ncbi:MAG: saccharopine dehydrogenase NADP-binding domain-containing protein [Sediminibacterium sp.]|nr:saccharopine dehydrogenase NADP-binding domain-containing protein [Sediminibacterium sp.]TXT30305.1 MAG: Saccharopine dehydrogenase [Chitinophagaceae bacterium]
MQNNQFLLYGANGYTGQLIAKMAIEYQLVPVLAGRNEVSIKELAASLNLSYEVINLDNHDELVACLRKFSVVLHAAGPFQFTSAKMLKACMEAHTHYLDITGEIGVFEQAKRYNDQAIQSEIMVMPGVGFDVVPTDCIAKFLHESMPNATHLKLAFATIGGRLSHGTATTMAEGMGEGGAVRENGKIVKKPLGHKGFWVDFGLKKLFVMCIPWGDVSTAYSTTGIPNIETYTMASPKTFSMLKWQGLYNWILRTSFVRNRFKKKIKQKPAGPDDTARAKAKCMVWGEVVNAAGEHKIARLTGPEGYTLTAYSSLIITKKVLEGNFKTGYQTPAGCYGANLVLEIPGVERESV